MIINKYLKTESNIVLVGKKAKVGGTSLLHTLYRTAMQDSAFAIGVYFESSSNRLHDILRLEGKLEMCSMAVPHDREVLVLVDEVGWLDESERKLLLGLVDKWSGGGNIKFICTGSEKALEAVFENQADTKYFNLVKYDRDGFVLVDTLGDTVTIESCII